MNAKTLFHKQYNAKAFLQEAKRSTDKSKLNIILYRIPEVVGHDRTVANKSDNASDITHWAYNVDPVDICSGYISCPTSQRRFCTPLSHIQIQEYGPTRDFQRYRLRSRPRSRAQGSGFLRRLEQSLGPGIELRWDS